MKFRTLTFGFTLILLVSCSNKNHSDITIASNTEFSFLDGEKKQLHDYAGKWLFVNFWSVSCAPCFKEMPELEKLQQELSNTNLNVIGVAMPYDRPDLILKTQQRKKLAYPLVIDILGKVNLAFGKVEVVPTSFLVNPEGVIIKKFVGITPFKTLKPFILEQQSKYQAGNI